MSTSTPAIQIVEPSIHDGDSLRKVPTNGSLPAIDEDKEHKQDWTITTDEKDSWAHKERRRSSVWGKLELVPYVPSLPSLRQLPQPIKARNLSGLISDMMGWRVFEERNK